MPNDQTPAKASRERIRLLYSLGDFQLALSAIEFLAECEIEENYSKIELRRFRCYETTAIIAYTRPFTQSHGQIPRLSLEMTGAKLTDEQTGLHAEVMRLRNKTLAHSDEAMMRMITKPHPIEVGSDFEFVFVETVFDEGLTFVGERLLELNELIRRVHHATVATLYKEAQARPADFDVCKDYTSKSIEP